MLAQACLQFEVREFFCSHCAQPLTMAILAVVERVRAELPDTAITVMYEDQITNDFRSVFYHAHGVIEPAGSMGKAPLHVAQP